MLTLFHGTDTYRMQAAVKNALAAYGDDSARPDVFSVDCGDDDALEQLQRPLKYPTLLDARKIIIARNAASAAVASVLKEFNLAKLEDIVFLAVQDTSMKSYDKAVLTALSNAAGRTEAFVALTTPQRLLWAREYCRTLNTDIDTAALDTVCSRAGSDTRLLAGELEKLAAYAQGATISTAMVELLTPARQEYDEWELSNAMAAHDKRAAITALWRRLQEGVPQQMLLGSLASGIRNLIIIKDLASRRQPASVIAKASGLHPFVVSKTLRGAVAADGGRLSAAHQALTFLDRASKDGRADATDGLFSVLLSL